VIIEISNYQVIIITIEEFLKVIVTYLKYFVILVGYFGGFVLVVKQKIIVMIVICTHDNNRMAKFTHPYYSVHH